MNTYKVKTILAQQSLIDKNSIPSSKSKTSRELQEKSFFNGDVLVIDGERYTVDNMHTVPHVLHPRQFSKEKNNTHLLFGGIHSVYNILSNWYPCKIKFNDHEFDSSEQAYQWAKADYCQDGTAPEKLLYTTSPREAK